MANITSPIWGGTSYPILTYHGEEGTWLDDYPEPCTLYAYTRNYGMTGCKHPGMDISMPHGTPIYALRAGTVTNIRNQDISGRMEIVITDALGHQLLYTHLSSRNVSTGNSVSAGQLIGASGTMNSPHLHFEHRVPDSSTNYGWRIIDPMPIIGGGGTTPPPPTGNKFAVHDRVWCHDGPLNMRSAPTTGATVVGSMPLNAEACVLEGPTNANGYNWYKLSYGSISGWSAENFLTLRTAQGCAPPPPDPEPEPEPEPEPDPDPEPEPEPPPPNPNKFAINDKAFCNDGPLNVRSSASTGAGVLGTVPLNADVCVMDGPVDASGYRWWKIKYNSLIGWSVENFLSLRTAQGCVAAPPPPPPPPPTWTHKVTGSNLRLRASASATASIIFTMPIGTKLKVNSGPVYAGGYTWYNVTCEQGYTGWCVNGFDPI